MYQKFLSIFNVDSIIYRQTDTGLSILSIEYYAIFSLILTNIYFSYCLTVYNIFGENVLFLYNRFILYYQQQEQDPTNLYIANLPSNFKENDLDTLLSKFGQVVSTRILRDTNMVSKGVGFARYKSHSCIYPLSLKYRFVQFAYRMDSKEKCEQIIQMFNGNPLPGSKEPLLVKFADSGQKKRNTSYRSDSRLWRESEVTIVFRLCITLVVHRASRYIHKT